MVTQYHAEELVKKGHEVTVLTSKIKGYPDSEIHNGVKIERMEVYNKGYWHFGNRKTYEDRLIKAGQTDDVLITVCLQSYAADWALGIMNKIKCRKVLYMHGMPDFKLHKEDYYSVHNLCKTIFRNLRWNLFYKTHWKKIMKYDAVVHLFKNDNSYTYFKNHGYTNNIVIENSCEDEFFHNDNETKPYFLYIGNYCQRKNQIKALELFYESEKLKDFGLVLIGGSENDYCKLLKKRNEQLSHKHGPRNVKILYGQNRESIIEYTKSAFASIMTSTFEYYPIVLVESMAAGVPFISTNVGIVRMLPGGIICNNYKDFIYWMELLAENWNIRNLQGNAGREYYSSHLRKEIKSKELENVLINR
ncbi:MAG: glycosyltransferase [Allobaculum sp.]|nr:glycosyltransferase [Allobaculum sp.]